MMLNPVIPEIFGAKSWRPSSDYRFAAATTLVRVAGAEIAQAALAMPLAFANNKGKASVVAVMGIKQNQNLFVAPNGHWAGRYVPALLRGWPFYLVDTPSGELALCFDDACELLGEVGEGEAFFDKEGKPSEAIKQRLGFLAELRHGQDVTDEASALLVEHGLLQSWPLKLKDGDQGHQVKGLQRVNEAALKGLPESALLALSKSGALAMAYAQLLSMGNISLLGQLYSAQSNATNRAKARTQASPPNGGGKPVKLFTPAGGQGMIDWKKLLEE